MQDAIDNHRIRFDFKEYPIIADAQSVFRRKVGEPLHVARQIVARGQKKWSRVVLTAYRLVILALV